MFAKLSLTTYSDRQTTSGSSGIEVDAGKEYLKIFSKTSPRSLWVSDVWVLNLRSCTFEHIQRQYAILASLAVTFVAPQHQSVSI